MFSFPSSDQGDEPARDERLGALLRDVVGDTPVGDVDWTALADRVGAAVRSQQAAPWWSYVARWQRSAIPLALAAGLVGALALWSAAVAGGAELAPFSGTPDFVTAVVSGESSADAALSYAGSFTSAIDLAAGLPE
jgi:hypothetical protein